MRECIRVCQNLHHSPHHFSSEWFIVSAQLAHLKSSIYSKAAAYTCDLLCDVIDKQVYPILAESVVRNAELEATVEGLER